jgi:dynein heavy chain
VQTIVGMGKFADYFRDRVTTWQKNLGTVESVLREWVSVTKAWASLESIFLASADIRAQLPDDTKRFEGIDQEFKELMKAAVETPNVVVSCNVEGREDKLKVCCARRCVASLVLHSACRPHSHRVCSRAVSSCWLSSRRVGLCLTAPAALLAVPPCRR